MTRWEPERYCKDETANALYNVAAQIAENALATRRLLYGLKYGERDGMSLAEAVEVAGKAVAEALDSTAAAMTEQAEAIDRLAGVETP